MKNCLGTMCPNGECALNYEPKGSCWLSDETEALADKIAHFVFEECNHEYDMSVKSPEYNLLLDFSENYIIELRRSELDNELIQQYEKAKKEYPELARLYNDFMAGDAPSERLKWEYENGGGVKAIIDEAKEKYRLLIEDMGFYI